MSGAERWLNRLDRIIEKNFQDPSLSNEQMANELRISERQLFRKVKELSGLTPQKYQRQFRLQRGMRFLKTGKYRTVKETAHAVGFIKVSYFIRQFENEFGKKPLQVLKENGWR